MSEYQYYEFAAVDAPLTREQQAELRACSSRAAITATSFTNEYHWGDLKGDPQDWMARYFDAHVYSAGWGECRFMLSLPKGVLDKRQAAGFTSGQANARGGYGGGAFSMASGRWGWIIDWSLNGEAGDDERFWHESDGPGWMARLLPLRDELLRGDLRALYLGWLARVCSCELDDDEPEPPVPPGLRALTPAQEALVEFLVIDPDLLAVAVEASADLDATGAGEAAEAWIDALPVSELRAAMRRLMAGEGRALERRMRELHAVWLREHGGRRPPAAEPRTVAQIEARRGRAGAAEAR